MFKTNWKDRWNLTRTLRYGGETLNEDSDKLITVISYMNVKEKRGWYMNGVNTRAVKPDVVLWSSKVEWGVCYSWEKNPINIECIESIESIEWMCYTLALSSSRERMCGCNSMENRLSLKSPDPYNFWLFSEILNYFYHIRTARTLYTSFTCIFWRFAWKWFFLRGSRTAGRV